jgi:hypothetical protein
MHLDASWNMQIIYFFLLGIGSPENENRNKSNPFKTYGSKDKLNIFLNVDLRKYLIQLFSILIHALTIAV